MPGTVGVTTSAEPDRPHAIGGWSFTINRLLTLIALKNMARRFPRQTNRR